MGDKMMMMTSWLSWLQRVIAHWLDRSPWRHRL